MILSCLVLLTWQCRKKDDECQQQSNVPEVNLSAQEMAFNPYYNKSQVSFKKNNQSVIVFNLSESKTEHPKLIDNTVEQSDECPWYVASYDEKTVVYKSNDGLYSLTSYQTTKPSVMSNDHGIALELGDTKTPANLQSYKTVETYVYMPATAQYVTIPSITVQGKVYHNVLLFSSTDNKIDSMYYTLTDGIIKATDSNGELYELVE
jgi:hypothetical protein